MNLRTILYLKALTIAILLCSSVPSVAATFGSNQDSSWAETPRGRFECRKDASTKYLQRITVAGALIYRESGNNPEDPGGPTLSSGILSYDPGCPDIIANQKGYVVIFRATQPPHYGVRGYGVINFNRPDFPVTELGQGYGFRDSKRDRLKWSATGISLKFFGWLVDEDSATTKSPAPKLHEVHFRFSNGNLDVIK